MALVVAITIPASQLLGTDTRAPKRANFSRRSADFSLLFSRRCPFHFVFRAAPILPRFRGVHVVLLINLTRPPSMFPFETATYPASQFTVHAFYREDFGD